MTLDQLVSEAQTAIALALEGSSNPCVTASFQHDCVALLYMVRAARTDIPVLFLETGYHFPETLEYRDRMTRAWSLNLLNLQARKQSVAAQESQFGILNQTAPDRCCALRKVEPLFAGLADFDTWFTALRREQSPARANLKIADDFRLPTGHELRKISPLASWTNRDVWQYLEHHSIAALPLYDQGYTSIGCQPWTSLPLSSDDLRSGRWQGKKLECGIHIQAQ